MMLVPTPEGMLVRGWSVFPVCADKRPAIATWKEFQRTRPSAAQVRDWVKRLRPRAWAVATGRISGLFVLDFDGDAGNATMQRLGLAPHVKTPSGGHHVYIEWPGFRVPTLNGRVKRELAKMSSGLDIRGEGGYVIFAGRNQAGEYRWVRKPDPDAFESLPVELQEFLKRCSEPEATNPVKRPKPTSKGRVSAEWLVSEALKRASGGRNEAGFWLATQARDNEYSRIEAEALMGEYADRVPGANTKGQPERYSEREALASVRQAYSRQPREPWHDGRHRHKRPEVGSPSIIQSFDDAPDLLSQHHNDHGNAERLVALHGQDLRFYHAIKRWLIWDGKRWLIDETRQAYKLAKHAILNFLKQAIESDDKDGERFARQSLNHHRISAMLASTECEQPITTADLDQDAYLLNCENGTLDLRDGQLRAHRRKDHITKLARVRYRPDAKCPVFFQFLHRIMGDGPPDVSQADGERAGRLVNYLQKVFGYSLSGDVSEKVIFCFFGAGNNGKTTLLEAIRFVLWEYSAQIQIDTLMSHRQRESNASLSDLADLHGARFVTTSEAEQGGRLAEGKLKYLSAGMGEVKTCRKYENPITFRATHKLFIDANHKPIIRGTDQAVWSRLKLTPFSVTIPPDEIDKDLLVKLKAEAEGILTWMVRGFQRWLGEGLGDPPEVIEASAGWRSEMSLLKDFIEDRCVTSPEAICPVGDLRRAYQFWAQENGERDTTWIRAFDDELTSKGCRKIRDRTGGKLARVWRGISLRADESGGE